MTTTWTIERPLHFRRARNGRAKPRQQTPASSEKPLLAGRVPRVAKLMALALHFENLLLTGEIAPPGGARNLF